MKGSEAIALFEEYFKTTGKNSLSPLDVSKRLEQSVTVDLTALTRFNSSLANEAVSSPLAFEEYAIAAIRNLNASIHEAIFSYSMQVRWTNPRSNQLPLVNFDIETKHLGRLVQIEGIIASASRATPEETLASWKCVKCGVLYHAVLEKGEKTPTAPEKCLLPNCGFETFTEMPQKTLRSVRSVVLKPNNPWSPVRSLLLEKKIFLKMIAHGEIAHDALLEGNNRVSIIGVPIFEPKKGQQMKRMLLVKNMLALKQEPEKNTEE